MWVCCVWIQKCTSTHSKLFQLPGGNDVHIHVYTNNVNGKTRTHTHIQAHTRLYVQAPVLKHAPAEQHTRYWRWVAVYKPPLYIACRECDSATQWAGIFYGYCRVRLWIYDKFSRNYKLHASLWILMIFTDKARWFSLPPKRCRSPFRSPRLSTVALRLSTR